MKHKNRFFIFIGLIESNSTFPKVRNKMARISENQTADLLEKESYSERKIGLDDNVDNLIISSDSESNQEEFVIAESSNQPSLLSSSQIVAYYLVKD
ncbi:hypothetical protein QTP88_021074 [Uroleucon formosanum]